jgi:hypothetical protein
MWRTGEWRDGERRLGGAMQRFLELFYSYAKVI